MAIYLYVKTHNITGLKYLGKTEAKDPHRYKGSGKYWKRHIGKYGYDVSTQILLVTENKEEIRDTGIFFSRLWNIVDDSKWANLKEESGDGGRPSDYVISKLRGKQISEETRQKLSKAKLGKKREPHTVETKTKISLKLKGHKVSDDTRKILSQRGKERILTEVHRERISAAHTGVSRVPHSNETKARMSHAQTGKRKSEETKKKISQTLKDCRQGPQLLPTFAGVIGHESNIRQTISSERSSARE